MIALIAIVLLAAATIAGTLHWASARAGLGGITKSLMSDAPGPRRLLNLTMVIVYLGFGVALPLIFIIGNHAKASAQVGGVKLTAAEKYGRALFGEHCAVCHTLVAAAAVGKTGPNLDILKPSKALVLHTVANGCLQNPGTNTAETCLGYGNMPADIVQGKDADDVAAFVSAVAGH